MTSKELAASAGIKTRSINAIAKKLFPSKISKGKISYFTELEGIEIMKVAWKKNFIIPNIQHGEISQVHSINNQVDNSLKDAVLLLTKNVELLIKSFDSRLSAVEQRGVLQIEHKPVRQIQMSFFTTRERIVNLVNEYHIKTKKKHSLIWSMLYKQLALQTGFNVTDREIIDSPAIDYVESEGFIEILENVAINFFA
jgi:hypothetical protein